MKCSMLAGLLSLVIAAAAMAGVNVPRGYYLVNLTNNAGFNRWCNINNHGQIVWSTGFDPFDGGTYEIMLYDEGEIRQITSNGFYDDHPDINDSGTIVWSSATGPGGVAEIWIYESGKARRLKEESTEATPRDNIAPSINDQGSVVWMRFAEPLCDPADSEIWIYDADGVRQLTQLGLSNQSPKINNRGDVIWTRYDFCPEPWQSEILILRNGMVEIISSTSHQSSQLPALTDDGEAFWSHRVPPLYQSEVVRWNYGQIDVITDWGSGPRVSDHGLLTFHRWFETDQTWQLYFVQDGHVVQLTDDTFWNFDGAINDRAEVAWTYGPSPNRQTRAILRYRDGDLNCDGIVNVADIASFVLALTNRATYDTTYPRCSTLLADLNSDGAVSVGDIGPFVHLLSKF